MKKYLKSSYNNTPFLKPLLEIPDIPKNLFVRGDLPELTHNTRILTVVGSRKYTSYGKDVCEKLIKSLAGTDTIIVSGLALGIDGIAHSAALDAGLKTIAILGNGLNDKSIYPKTHINLAHEIIESGGALISEYEPDFEARNYTFPARNRIAVGLSQAILVIEAEEKSGTLITARLGVEYNRDVLTVPGSIFNESSKGTNSLLRLGATPITSQDDLFEALRIVKEADLNETNKNIDLSDLENRLLDILYEPKTKDSLFAETGMPANEGMVALTLLEMKGLVKEEFGFVRKC